MASERLIGNLADDISSWKASLGEFCVYHEMAGLQNEMLETTNAYDDLDWTTESMRNLGLEASDVIVRALGVIGSLHLDPDELLGEVLAKAKEKYDPEAIQALQDEGYSLYDAMSIVKLRYNEAQSETS